MTPKDNLLAAAEAMRIGSGGGQPEKSANSPRPLTEGNMAREEARLARRRARLLQEGDLALKDVIADALAVRAEKEGVDLSEWRFDGQKDITMSDGKPKKLTFRFSRESVIDDDKQLEAEKQRMYAEAVDQMTRLGLHPTPEQLAEENAYKVNATRTELSTAEAYAAGEKVLATGQLLHPLYERRFDNIVRHSTSEDGSEHIITQDVVVSIPEAALKKELGITHTAMVAGGSATSQARG